MSIPRFEFARARTIRDACAQLAAARGGAEVVAGGTELLVAMKHGTRAPRLLVDLTAVPGLDRLVFTPDVGLVIGARVTLARLAADPHVRTHYPAIAEAALAVGTLQLRSMGTVAGNLCQDTCCLYVDRSPQQRHGLVPCHKIDGDRCHVVAESDQCWANYAGDLAPVLLALGASIVVATPAGEAIRPLPALYSCEGIAPITLAAGEIITAIAVPAPPASSGAAYLKLRQRNGLDYPLLGVAAAIALGPDRRCRHARVALTGVERGPIEIPDAAALEGRTPDDEAFAPVAEAAARRAHPVKNAFGFGPSYRVRMTRPYVVRALRAATARAEGVR